MTEPRVSDDELRTWLDATPNGLSSSIDFAALRTYDIGLDPRDARQRIAELEAALSAMVDSSERWNEAMQSIIGRQPQTGIGLQKAKAVSEAKRGLP